MNLRKNEGFLTSIPCISIPEYGQLNVPLVWFILAYLSVNSAYIGACQKNNCKISGYLIVVHETAVNLATFVAFLIGVGRRILLTRKGFSPLTKTFINQ